MRQRASGRGRSRASAAAQARLDGDRRVFSHCFCFSQSRSRLPEALSTGELPGSACSRRASTDPRHEWSNRVVEVVERS
jgi:hypothetical protein